MGIRLFGLRTPSNHRPPPVGECIRACDSVLVCASFGDGASLERRGRIVRIFADRSESSSEIWFLNAVHVSLFQWGQASGLGFGSSAEQSTEWKSNMGGSSVQCEHLAWPGLVPILIFSG